MVERLGEDPHEMSTRSQSPATIQPITALPRESCSNVALVTRPVTRGILPTAPRASGERSVKSR